MSEQESRFKRASDYEAYIAELKVELKVQLMNAQTDVQFWRDRCAVYEAHHAKLEVAAADIRGRVEQFLVVLQHARPQGTERRASEER